jgi:hypothetical protein
MAETQVARRFRWVRSPDTLERLTEVQWLAGLATVATLLVYAVTALRGVSFGDWAEMQQVPARLEVPHPTGFPLYVLLGKVFSLIPIGSVAFRANLLSAAAAAAAVGMLVLIAGRLGVRPVVALAAAIALAGTATLWQEATFSEMNTLHLFLSAIVFHRALVWRDERRDRDLRLGALFSGLALSNHLLAVSVVTVVVLFVLIEDRLRILRRPRLLLELVLLFAAGLSFYLFIVIRAFAGPPEVYGGLRTLDGLISFISGAQFRADMQFGTAESLAEAWRAVPDLVAGIERGANAAFSLVPIAGAAILVRRDRWAGWLTVALVAVNVYMFVGYRGDLPHYLLLTWLILAVWLAVAAEAALGWLRSRLGSRLGSRLDDAEFALVGLAALFLVSNWAAHDQSANRLGEEYTRTVFERLPPNAVLVTYWDSLTTLGYAHCIEGQRPDIAVIAHDRPLTASCDIITEPLESVARDRPIYALALFDTNLERLRPSFELIPEAMFKVPYGGREPGFTRTLYRLEPKAPSG